MPPILPIDEVLPELKRALAAREAVVLQAPPGAGKTTRVPLALLDEEWLAGQGVLILEPRRLAATNAARYMASLLGEEVGETVGYTIRFDRKVSRKTRIEVVTEGILTRRLQNDPALEGVGVVIFDEFHERSLHSDLALALCRDAQLGLRDDLKLLVMSATLDAAPVARLLGEAPLVSSQGRSFPVEVRYAPPAPRTPVPQCTAAAVRRALRETQGDVLAFLPGAGEIRRCRELLADVEVSDGLLLAPLYADLPFSEQERAIRPAAGRKVVLATNIAETSLTIEGVRTVVDSGLSRQPRFHPGSGLTRLETVRISRASAEQRAGRAGRLAPGVCYRLWSEGEHGALLPFTPPEIRNADLAPLALELALWGVSNAQSLAWLDPPPPGALEGGRGLLRLLGAVDDGGRITPLGEEMARLPLHPRLARLLVAACRCGQISLGCDLAALLSERDIFRRDRVPPHPTESDLADRLEALNHWRRHRGGTSVDSAACAAADRASRQFAALLGHRREGNGGPPSSAQIACLVAPAWPDRIGREREAGSGRYLLSGGKGGRLAGSGLRGSSFLVAIEMEGESGGEGLIRQASALTPERIEELFAGVLSWRREVIWDDREDRIVAREVRRLGALVLATRPVAPEAEEGAAAIIEGIRRLGLEALNWTPAARQLVDRVRFVAEALTEEEWPDFSPKALLGTLEEWLGPFLQKIRSRADLMRLDLLPPLEGRLSWTQRRRLDHAAPTELIVPSGHRISIDYESGEPVLAVKLQELFGLAETPRVAEGRVPVLLHLLSPARRPIQVTRDLRSFWDCAYAEVKKELKGRYPKHPWPDDPWSAEATRRTKRP